MDDSSQLLYLRSIDYLRDSKTSEAARGFLSILKIPQCPPGMKNLASLHLAVTMAIGKLWSHCWEIHSVLLEQLQAGPIAAAIENQMTQRQRDVLINCVYHNAILCDQLSGSSSDHNNAHQDILWKQYATCGTHEDLTRTAEMLALVKLKLDKGGKEVEVLSVMKWVGNTTPLMDCGWNVSNTNSDVVLRKPQRPPSAGSSSNGSGRWSRNNNNKDGENDQCSAVAMTPKYPYIDFRRSAVGLGFRYLQDKDRYDLILPLVCSDARVKLSMRLHVTTPKSAPPCVARGSLYFYDNTHYLKFSSSLCTFGTVQDIPDWQENDRIVASLFQFCEYMWSSRVELGIEHERPLLHPGAMLLAGNNHDAPNLAVVLPGSTPVVPWSQGWVDLEQLGLVENAHTLKWKLAQESNEADTIQCTMEEDGNCEAIPTSDSDKGALLNMYLDQFTQRREPLDVTLSRGSLIDDLSCFVATQYTSTNDEIARPLRVSFEGESCIDLGGVTSDAFSHFVEGVLHDDTVFDAQLLPVTGNSHEFLLECLGKILMKCIVDRRCLGMRCHPLVIKYLHVGEDAFPTQTNVSGWLKELRRWDPMIASSLTSLLNNGVPQGSHVDVPSTGAVMEGPLTRAQVEAYVCDVSRWMLYESRKAHMVALRRGFLGAGLDIRWLMCVTDIVDNLQGRDTTAVTADALIRNLEFRGWESEDSTPYYLCCFLRNAVFEDLAMFLRFVTSLPAIPRRGLTKRITVFKTTTPESGLFGHTCFMHLDLPPFESYEDLEGAFHAAFVAMKESPDMYDKVEEEE
eukprot:PhF_6_TR18934/c0_g1_i1/m.27725